MASSNRSPYSRSFRKAANRLERLDRSELERGLRSGRRRVDQLLKLSRAYLEEAQGQLQRFEKETRPLRQNALERIEEWEVESRPLRRKAARRAMALSYEALDRIDERAGTHQRRRRGRSWLGVWLSLIAGVGVGYLVADRRSRAALKGGLVKVQDEAKHRVPALVDTLDDIRSRWSRGGSAAEEAALRARVEAALTQAGASGLEVGVEGRTVYLKGAVAGREALDSAIERARSVEGVAAVINLATAGSAKKA